MSYLILPLLIEGGYTTEMLRLSKNIVTFHESAKRDTLTSVAKSFTYCNYAKVFIFYLLYIYILFVIFVLNKV